jgi:hypothetical protein
MKGLYKGLIIAALHVALVASLGAKLLYDRSTRPRVWAQTTVYDPDLPIRGRYLGLQLIVETEGFPLPTLRKDVGQWGFGNNNERRARLEVRANKLVAVHDEAGDYTLWFTPAPGVTVKPLPSRDCSREPQEKQSACATEEAALQSKAPVDFPLAAVLNTPVLYFIPEHAVDPTPRGGDGKELWAEVTIPKKGPPRPIQLALKKNGVWMPLDVR